MRRTAALILGGGPAGAAAAIGLARAGARPLLVERSPGPRNVVCGGFLGRDALAALAALDIDVAALGARPIHRLRLIAGDRSVEAALPFAAAGLSRRTLDEALLAGAAATGAQIVRGCAIRAADPATLSVQLADGADIAADALFLATGKHELRGLARPLANRRRAPSIGLRTALAPSPRLAAALDGIIELHLFDGGYAGLLLQEDGSANLCLSASRERLAAAGGADALRAAIAAEAPLLGARIAAASGPWQAVAGVPYGWRAHATHPGIFRIGDQGAVIASLAGDGVAIALASAAGATAAWHAGGAAAAERWQSGLARRAAWPLAVAEALRFAAERRVPRAAMMTLLRLFPDTAAAAAILTRIA